MLPGDGAVLDSDLPIAGGYIGHLQVRSVLWNGGMEDVAQLVVPHPMLEMESIIADPSSHIFTINYHCGLCKGEV